MRIPHFRPTPPAGSVLLNPLAPEDSNEYEDIRKYSEMPKAPVPKGSEFSVTTCPAYIPTARSAHLDTEYEPVQVPSQGPQQGQGSVYDDVESKGPVQGQSSAGSEYAEVAAANNGAAEDERSEMNINWRVD